jgi:enoyl-CoA hydratase
MPDETGAWCALTGDRMKTADGVATGIATHHVRSERFPDLLDALCGNVSVDALLAAFAEPAGEGPVAARRGAIRSLFAADRVEDILAALDAETGAGAEWAHATAATMRKKSPTSLKIALAQVRRGRGWSFEECMQAEMRIVSRIVEDHDFYEGVRAAIVDKDNAPRWRPALLAEVSDAEVDRHFAPLAAELVLA